jgi:hypothetical protein
LDGHEDRAVAEVELLARHDAAGGECPRLKLWVVIGWDRQPAPAVAEDLGLHGRQTLTPSFSSSTHTVSVVMTTSSFAALVPIARTDRATRIPPMD